MTTSSLFEIVNHGDTCFLRYYLDFLNGVVETIKAVISWERKLTYTIKMHDENVIVCAALRSMGLIRPYFGQEHC